MKKLTVAASLIAALGMMANAYATDAPTADKQAATNQNKTPDASQGAVSQRAWLGVSLKPVPEALSRQLSSVIPDKQGVLIQSVMPNSPADKAGLKAYDIILGLGDQKIYSAQQLVGLITSSKPGNQVALNVVRDGKLQTINVTLEGRPVMPSASHRPWFGGQHPARPHWPRMPGFGQQPYSRPYFSQPPFPAPVLPKTPLSPKALGQANVMQQFESIQIRSLDGDRYHAEVEYQENGGEKKKFTFEGKYDEIREQIKNNKELPESKKNSLLNALKNNPDQLLPDNIMQGFPAFPPMPSLDQFFNDKKDFNQFFDKPPAWFNQGRKL